MQSRSILRPISFLTAFAIGFVFEPLPMQWLDTGFVKSAEARAGRPATPRSAAGVARRTTRRTVRRTTAYVATLPAGCARVSVNGMALYSCGGTYYQDVGGQYVVVIVD